MANVTLQNSSLAPAYAAVSGNVPARLSSGKLQVFIDQMAAAVPPLLMSKTLARSLMNTSKRIVNVGAGRGFPVETEVPYGHLHRATNSIPILPQHEPASRDYAFVDTKQYYMSATFNGLFLQRAKNSRGAMEFAASDAEQTIKELTASLVDDQEMKLFQDGSGVLANVTANVTSTTVNVEHWYNPSSVSLNGATYFLKKGQSVTFINSGTGLPVFQTRIANTSFANGQITLAANPGSGVIAAGDYIVRGDVNGSEYGIAIGGLYSPFMATTTLGGAGSYLQTSYATHEAWSPLIFDNSGTLRTYDPALVVEALTYAENEWGGIEESGIDFMFSSSEVWYEHHRHVKNLVQYATFEVANKTMMTVPVFQVGTRPVAWKTHRYMVPNHILGVDTASYERLVDMDFQIQKDGGGVLHNVPNTDSYYVWGKGYEEWFCHSPRRNFLITDIQTTERTIRG